VASLFRLSGRKNFIAKNRDALGGVPQSLDSVKFTSLLFHDMDKKASEIENSPQMAALTIRANQVYIGVLGHLFPDGVFEGTHVDVRSCTDE
jgi:hypothetical protein